MRLRLRQIALAVPDLAVAHEEVAAVFGVRHHHEDPGVLRYGLRNAVIPFGNSFLELLAPIRGETTVGRLLDKRRGAGGYMVILQCDDISQARARICATGVRTVDQLDRNGAGFTHLHPRDVGGTLLSIDYMDEWDRWEWAGSGWKAQSSTASEAAIIGAEMQGEDPVRIGARWSAVLGRPLEPHDGGWRIVLDDSELRFVGLRDDRGEGFRAFDIWSSHPELVRTRAAQHGSLLADGSVALCGMVIQIVGADA